MIAHFPMYDVPGNRQAQIALWTAFRDHYPKAPTLQFAPSDLMADWQNPSLFLSQTCGLPFRAKLHGQVQLVATPDTQIAGCPPGHYHSVIVARNGAGINLASNDFTLVYNDPLSQSGWAAPHAMGITGSQRTCSGGHAKSAQMVADGTADVAAIDALTWAFLQRDWTGAAHLDVIAKTPPTPTLPYITAPQNDALTIRAALAQAILDIGPQDRETLQVFGLVDIPAPEYLSHALPPAP